MTTITKSDVEKIAHLARLSIQESDIQKYASTLTNIMELVEHINKAQTDNITPMAHPLAHLTQRLRKDVVTETDQHILFQSIAPQTEADVYLVPKVIDEA